MSATRHHARQPAHPLARVLRGAYALAPKRWRVLSARRFEAVAARDRQRFAVAVSLALAINIVILTALGVFGRVRIWAPNAPARTISIVVVDTPVEPLIPDLREPEIIPEPEPEEVEILEEPDLEEEPNPEPTPEPEEALQEEEAPEDDAPEPEPEPDLDPTLDIDLTPEPAFAPPGEELQAPLVEEIPAPQEAEDDLAPADAPSDDLGDQAEIDQLVDDDQAPAPEEEDPLLNEADAEAGVEMPEEEASEDGDTNSGEGAGDEAPSEGEDDERFANDDIFDQAPSRFIQPRRRLPLPNVDLPAGEAAALPGDSGVVAIYCPETFVNQDKQLECAGRPEIRSGWRPGASGEDFSQASRLLGERREGGVATAGDQVLTPSERRRREDIRRAEDLNDFRRSADSVNEQAQGSDNLGQALNRPDIGASEFEPSWTKRDDPTYDQGDIDALEEELRKAAEEKGQ